ncbi:hypothetical protein L6270_00125 [Candidatus Parcubacteria bacterium]|nr:hypothetical protein [Patescibacteria group bacterium]MBU4309561.1 hypothetical protein [Patescibacteria group bacterium]MBU4432347.1 hypothetical protein [Patescibacteria group bacterium]MBU4578051.1 hypothetical protein [Patescibacteria group bacterium]MCG2696441.1 hypothetical protein [Candidatus Parcubacteria bacterium]
MTHPITLKTSGFNLNHVGWKYYNTIKKKAMEQEFSWAGLALSLSIAFFVVFSTAVILNLVNKSFEQTRNAGVRTIYRLEAKSEYLQGGLHSISSSPFFSC